MNALSVSVAFWDYDRTMPLADGRVKIEGCAPHFDILPPQETFPRAHVHAEFDISELSLSRHAQAMAAGDGRYAGLPVFLSRAFRHAALYVRADLALDSPRDLAGKRIGLNNYDDTAAVAVRGLLRDCHGLGREAIVWVVGDIEAATRPRLVPPKLHAAIPVVTLPPGATLMEELRQGRLDGLIALNPPAGLRAEPPLLRRVFPDWRRAEQDYFRATGHFPIMHVLGLRATLHAAHPWLADSVMRAFTQAKAMAMDNLANLQACKATLPWVAAELAETRALMGPDYWPYGLAPNRPVLAAMLRHLWEDGLLARQLAPEELFVTTAPPHQEI